MKKKIITLAAAAMLLGVPILAHAAASIPAGPPTQPAAGFAQIGRQLGNMNAAVSDILGLPAADVQTERLSGKSLAAIAQEHGISENSLIASMEENRSVILQKLVDDGKITQEQADLCLAQMKERLSANVIRTETGRPDYAGANRGNGRGFAANNRMMHGPFSGQGQARSTIGR